MGTNCNNNDKKYLQNYYEHNWQKKEKKIIIYFYYLQKWLQANDRKKLLAINQFLNLFSEQKKKQFTDGIVKVA